MSDIIVVEEFRTITIENRPINHLKLHRELCDAGIIPEITQYPNGKFEVKIRSSQYDQALQIIQQHDPTPDPEPPSAEDILMDIQAAIAYLLGGGLQ